MHVCGAREKFSADLSPKGGGHRAGRSDPAVHISPGQRRQLWYDRHPYHAALHCSQLACVFHGHLSCIVTFEMQASAWPFTR